MNRLDRLTAILIQLQSKRVVRAQEIAERFGISLRTVYRDVRSLEVAGVPIIGEAGIGYSMVDGYRLPPVQFTTDEAAALLTAEKLVRQYTDAGIADQYQAGLLKIRSVLRLADKDFLEQLDDAVLVLNTHAVAEQNLPILLQAISKKEVLLIHYAGQKDEKAAPRNIEPIGIFLKNNAWYVVAWCQLREDIRNFRLDRMQGVRKTDRIFEGHTMSLQDYLDENDRPNPPLKASITVPNDVLPFIERQKHQQGFMSEHTEGAVTIMQFQTTSYAYLARWAMQFADKVVALTPPELLQTFRQIVADAYKKIHP